MLKRTARAFSLFLSLFSGVILLSQEPISINYTPKDGLLSVQVYDVHQDNNGLIWFGTDRGISSFNGKSFKNYGKNEGLNDTRINHFFP
ncbi:MAG: two-component regulator propeller domain-containing protein [Bacteroidia bacterium]